MTQVNHTPGPWNYVESKDFGQIRFYIRQQNGNEPTASFSDATEIVCGIVLGENYEMQKANATLIAAAPELLDALQKAESLIDTLAMACIDRVDSINDERRNTITTLLNKFSE